jgi:hypothetical protein
VIKIASRPNKVVLLGVPAAALLGAAWVLLSPREASTQAARHRLKVPSLVDVGAVDNGRIKVARVEISNPGGRAVTLTEFKGSCACMSVYQGEPPYKAAIDKLVVGPRAASAVLIDILVGGDPGVRQGTSLSFRDAEKEDIYSVPIVYTPIASIYTLPRSVSFGNVLTTERVTQRVELRSRTRLGSGPPRVVTPGATPVSARLVPASGAQTEMFEIANPGQHLVGYVDLTLDPAAVTGNVREVVTISKEGMTTAEITVSAEIVPQHSLTPARLILPRRSSAGALSSAKIICRSRSGQRFTVELGLVPAPFRAEVEQPSEPNANLAFIKLEYVGSLPQDAAKDYVLPLKVVESARVYSLACPIRVLPAAP